MAAREVELYFNETHGPAFWEYRPDATLRCGFRGVMELSDDDPTALEQVWAAFNADDRPNGQTERSLSVGDVVTLDRAVSYATADVGFRRIDQVHSGGEIINALQWAERHPRDDE